ncbi:MAG: FHA domain-containing protein [Deltaproteobacteria bacterium]
MAKEMGNDRDGLINQALFTFARLNGYLAPGGAMTSDAGGPAAPHVAKPPEAPAHPAPRREPVEPPAPAAPPAVAPRRAPAVDHDSALRRASPPAVPRVSEPAPPLPPKSLEDDPERKEAAARVLETAAVFERSLKDKAQDELREVPTRDGHSPPKEPGEGKALYLMAEDGNLDKVAKDRFVIGRGKHCDLVINSGKVSREHAAIVREGTDYFIEDLGSSNGTWFQKQRIRRRKIEDGDEFFICSEKVKCVVR